MDRSIADELYSHILKSSNGQGDPRVITDNTHNNSHDMVVKTDCDGDDLWYDDEALHGETEKVEKLSDMDREWQRRHDQFHTIGYRDGLMAGKEASAQEGFNVGFKESVLVGQRLGLARGVTSALACLPNGLKERLIEIEGRRDRFQHLHESIRALSTTDVLKLFHDGLKDKLTKQGWDAEISSQTDDLPSQNSDVNVLENYMREFKLLILETSAIKVQQEKDVQN